MKLTKTFEKEDLANKLDDNKEFLLPVFVLVVGIFIILFLVLPRMMSLPSEFSKRNTEVARLNEIKQAKDILENINDTDLNNQVEIVSAALPSDRDFEGIFNAIATSANLSNTQVSGYKFTELIAQGTETDQTVISRPLEFTITISGTPDQAGLFIEELYKTSPISAVKSIEYEDGETEIVISFFYKPFTTLDQNSFLPKELTPEQQKIYSELQAFTKSAPEPEFDFEDSTPSALPLQN